MDSPFPTSTVDIGGVAISVAGPRHDRRLARRRRSSSGSSSASRSSASRCAPSAINPSESRLVGVRVSWMLGARLGARRGARRGRGADRRADAVPRPEHDAGDPDLRVRGGRARRDRLARLGAVVGGLILGVGLNLLGTYVDFVGTELRLPVALAVILVVLLVRPAGLFGRAVVRRV